MESSKPVVVSLPQLSRDCKVEVQRILHQRALDVKLDPELQKRCIVDLGKWCSEKPDAGQVRPQTLNNLSEGPLLDKHKYDA